MSAAAWAALAFGLCAVVALAGWLQLRRHVAHLNTTHAERIRALDAQARRDADATKALQRELQLREIRLSGKPTWVDGCVDEANNVHCRFALDGGVIVGAVVREGSDESWRGYGRLPAGQTDHGSMQWSLFAARLERAQAEAERIHASLLKHEREHAARREAL